MVTAQVEGTFAQCSPNIGLGFGWLYEARSWTQGSLWVPPNSGYSVTQFCALNHTGDFHKLELQLQIFVFEGHWAGRPHKHQEREVELFFSSVFQYIALLL